MPPSTEPPPSRATGGPAASARAMPGRPRVRPRWIMAGVVALVLAALGAWYIVDSVQTQNHVVVLRHDVPRGSVLTAEALGQVTVGNVNGVSTVSADMIPSLVGKVALIDLAQGALLPDGAVSDHKVPGEGKSLVGLVLAPGRVPAGTALRAGSPVRLVTLPAESSGGSGKTFTGTVVSVQPAADGVGVLVNVEVDASAAIEVQTLAAADRVAVVLDAD